MTETKRGRPNKGSCHLFQNKGYKMLNDIKNYKLIPKGGVYAKKGDLKLNADEDFYPHNFWRKNYKDIFSFKGKN